MFSEQGTLDLISSRFGNAPFSLLPAVLCDAENDCAKLESRHKDSIVTVVIPRSIFTADTVYPVILDPPITMGDPYWNGYVQDAGSFPTSYTRGNNPTDFLLVGKPSPISTASRKSAIDWDVSAIPASAKIHTVTLQLRINQTNRNPLNITALQEHPASNTTTGYNDSNSGNEAFYSDISNGTIYNSTVVSAGTINLTLSSSAISDLKSLLADGWFSIGLNSIMTSPEFKINSKDDPRTANRPILYITYEPVANETAGDQAIEQGIQSTLVSPAIQSDQQVYILNENGQQFLGRFDKFTQSGNQSWGLNYVTPGESFTNIPSLFKIFNVWENQSLLFDEIVFQVSSYINETIA